MNPYVGVLLGGVVALISSLVTQIVSRRFQLQSERRLIAEGRRQKFFEYDLQKLRDIENILERLFQKLSSVEDESTTEERDEIRRKCLFAARDVHVQLKLLNALNDLFEAIAIVGERRLELYKTLAEDIKDLLHETTEFVKTNPDDVSAKAVEGATEKLTSYREEPELYVNMDKEINKLSDMVIAFIRTYRVEVLGEVPLTRLDSETLASALRVDNVSVKAVSRRT